MALIAFAALGVWQVQRLQWKHALIARVDARIHASPVALPADAALANASEADPRTRDLEYLRVKLSGVYQGSATALVRAATDLGTGYWTMTPLRMDDGRQVWINRGFVPEGTSRAVAAASTPAARIAVSGLLRFTEPGGSLLQANRPQDDRWYSRDVAGLAAARRLGAVVPAFVDVQVEQTAQIPASAVKPVPGLTQVHFPDNHLMYALTWFALAGLSAFGLVYIWRRA